MIKPRFIDLCCGIGGFRIGFEQADYQCVFSSDIDKHCQRVYYDNFGERPAGDIKEINIETIPEYEVLCAGFPCQPFSISGKKQGFNDTRGTVFFDILRIIQGTKPKIVVLENVKNLIYHDNKNTFKTIIKELENLGYKTSWSILNASAFGVPQNRERIIIVAFFDNVFDFNLLERKPMIPLKYFLGNNDCEYLDSNEYTLIDNPKKQKSGLIFAGYMNKNIRKSGVRPNTTHLSRVHKQPNRIYSEEGLHPTLSAQETSGRYFVLTSKGVRKLSLDECYKIMGFPDEFIKSNVPTHAYKQIGNSVCIPMIKEISVKLREKTFA